MEKYSLIYSEPYEFDDDSSSGIGDHDVCWTRDSETNFEAENDETAQTIVSRFVSEEIKIMGQSLYRQPIRLIKIIQVKVW